MKTTQAIVDLLNQLGAIDPKAISELIFHRVPINPKLASSSFAITVATSGRLGMLGILNGLAIPESCKIVAHVTPKNTKIRFSIDPI